MVKAATTEQATGQFLASPGRPKYDYQCYLDHEPGISKSFVLPRDNFLLELLHRREYMLMEKFSKLAVMKKIPSAVQRNLKGEAKINKGLLRTVNQESVTAIIEYKLFLKLKKKIYFIFPFVDEAVSPEISGKAPLEEGMEPVNTFEKLKPINFLIYKKFISSNLRIELEVRELSTPESRQRGLALFRDFINLVNSLVYTETSSVQSVNSMVVRINKHAFGQPEGSLSFQIGSELSLRTEKTLKAGIYSHVVSVFLGGRFESLPPHFYNSWYPLEQRTVIKRAKQTSALFSKMDFVIGRY